MNPVLAFAVPQGTDFLRLFLIALFPLSLFLALLRIGNSAKGSKDLQEKVHSLEARIEKLEDNRT